MLIRKYNQKILKTRYRWNKSLLKYKYEFLHLELQKLTTSAISVMSGLAIFIF